MRSTSATELPQVGKCLGGGLAGLVDERGIGGAQRATPGDEGRLLGLPRGHVGGRVGGTVVPGLPQQGGVATNDLVDLLDRDLTAGRDNIVPLERFKSAQNTIPLVGHVSIIPYCSGRGCDLRIDEDSNSFSSWIGVYTFSLFSVCLSAQGAWSFHADARIHIRTRKGMFAWRYGSLLWHRLGGCLCKPVLQICDPAGDAPLGC
ncbi:hypothetical protein FRACA_2160008 [Frankia canadensis]|uniref:Uncharacterized protein n=1 Tax=Frankia canadensis TaxID=1836972 RepID=A0A2I2KQT4_9ACTN|nr:hypothetical protein FRACA_2160008 [Frankia canadensis]SOU55317.1 hypothetical protein FRACA_2160008 [Frankia canadensis]